MTRPAWRELRHYQEDAIEFIVSRPGAGLFIDMGLGKTAATLHALLELPKPVLLVAPLRVVETVWAQEAANWPGTCRLRFATLRGKPNQRKAAAEKVADVYMVNPELLPEALELRSDYKTLVIDESTMFKNPSTVRFKVLRRVLKRFARRIILTGTPTPNGLEDLWSQVFLLDGGQRLGTSFSKFRQTYFYQTDYLGYKFAPHDWAEQKILDLIADVIFRVPAKGALEPREVVHNPVRVTLPPSVRKVYNSLEREAFAKLTEDDTITAATAPTVLMKLRQVASGFVYDEDGIAHAVHDEKIKAVAEILEQTSSPVILLYQFKHELKALREAFPQGKIFEPELQEEWNAGEIPLLFLHPASGGHGLNLQYGGHTMVVFSASFSYEQMSQAMARIDRQGQEFPVIFHHIVATDTVDDLLMEVLKQKEEGQTRLLDILMGYANAKAKAPDRS